MPSPKSTCPICYTEYNQNTHIPRIIPSCGHTLCSKCLTGIIGQSSIFRCPIDRTVYNPSTRNVSSFPINYALQDIINEDAGYELCEHHEERMRLVCIRDKCKVCDDCVLYGSHRGHDIKPLKKVQAEANKKIETLETRLGEVKGWHKKFEDSLSDKEKFFLEAIRKRFESLRAVIKDKEAEVTKEVQNFFSSERREMNSFLGEGSSLQKTIRDQISDLRNAARDNNLAKIFQDTNPQSANFSSNFFQQRLQDLNQRLQEIEASVDQPLMTQVLLLKNLEIKISDFLEAKRGSNLPRSSSEAFLKSSSRPLDMKQLIGCDGDKSMYDAVVPNSARNLRESKAIRQDQKCVMPVRPIRETFLPNSPSRNSIKSRPRLVGRNDGQTYALINKTTLQ